MPLSCICYFREWYSYHFPELVKIVNDNTLFAKLVRLIKRRTNINEELFAPSTLLLFDFELMTDQVTTN